MQTWLMIFSIVAAMALIVQGAMLIALFFEVRQTNKKVNGLVTDLHTRVGPILTRAQILLDDTQPKISNMGADAEHIVYLTRGQAQKMDRVLTDATDRLRGQLNHAARILTGALEAVEDAGAQFRSTVWRPMQKPSAPLKGIKFGTNLLTWRPASRTPWEPLEQEDELFI